MNEVEVQFLDCKFETNNRPALVKIIFLQENQALEFQKIHESRIIDVSDKSTRRAVVHEVFSFLTPTHRGMFLKILLKYKMKPDSSSWLTKHGYIFFADLDKLKKGYTIKLDKKNKFRVYLDARLESSMDNVLKTVDKKPKGSKEDQVKDTDLIEMYKVSKLFMQKVTPIRRLSDQVESFIRRDDPRRDAKVYMWLCVWFFLGRYLLLGTALYLLFTPLKYRVRLGFINWGMGFFEPEEKSVEMNKNLAFLMDQQLMMIKLSSFLKHMFYSKNRRMVFGISTYSVPIIITIALIHCFTMGQFMAGIIFYLLTLKYKHRIPEAPLPSFFKRIRFFGRLYSFNFWKSITPAPKEKKLTKTCILIENQRWFMREGFTSGRIPFGLIIRSAKLLRCQRRKGP